MLRNTPVVGHISQGSPGDFASACDVVADHAVASFLHGVDVFAVATDRQAFQLVAVDQKRCSGIDASIKTQAEYCFAVITDGVKRRAVGIEAQTRWFIQPQSWVSNVLLIDQAETQLAFGHVSLLRGCH